MRAWRTRTGFGLEWLTDDKGTYLKLGWLCLAWKRDTDWRTARRLAVWVFIALC